MAGMEWQTKLRWLLVVAHVAVAGALMVALLNFGKRPRAPMTLFVATFSLATCQVYLASAWSVLSRASWQSRIALAAACVPAWVLTMGRYPADFLTYLAFLLPIAGIAALLACLARFAFGYRLTAIEAHGNLCPYDVPRDFRRYSLRSLMILMTVAAVMCALLRVLLAPWRQDGAEMWPFLAGTVIANSVLLHAWFREDPYGIMRTLTFLAVAIASTVLRGTATRHDDAFIMLISLFDCAFTAATLQGLRVSGIRLTRMTAGNRPSSGHATLTNAESIANA